MRKIYGKEPCSAGDCELRWGYSYYGDRNYEAGGIVVGIAGERTFAPLKGNRTTNGNRLTILTIIDSFILLT